MFLDLNLHLFAYGELARYDILSLLHLVCLNVQTEYRRQGMEHAFDAILTEIVNALEDSSMALFVLVPH